MVYKSKIKVSYLMLPQFPRYNRDNQKPHSMFYSQLLIITQRIVKGVSTEFHWNYSCVNFIIITYAYTYYCDIIQKVLDFSIVCVVYI